MTSQDFIKNKIDLLVSIFPNIKCRYEYEADDDTHTIEITPDSFYNSNIDLPKLEREITTEFIRMFPSEGLFFVTDKSRYPVAISRYTKAGATFDKTFIIAKFISNNFTNPYMEVKEIDEAYLFETAA